MPHLLFHGGCRRPRLFGTNSHCRKIQQVPDRRTQGFSIAMVVVATAAAAEVTLAGSTIVVVVSSSAVMMVVIGRGK